MGVVYSLNLGLRSTAVVEIDGFEVWILVNLSISNPIMDGDLFKGVEGSNICVGRRRARAIYRERLAPTLILFRLLRRKVVLLWC